MGAPRLRLRLLAQPQSPLKTPKQALPGPVAGLGTARLMMAAGMKGNGMRKYYTLAVRIDGRWSPEFGDYDRECVQVELAGYLDSGAWKRKDLKIVTTDDNQAAIDAAIRKLNGEE